MAITTDSLIGKAILFLWFLIYLGWIYSIGIAGYERLHDKKGISIQYFRNNFIFIACYVLALNYSTEGGYTITNENYQDFGAALWVIVPLHLYFMWSMLYMFYFAAKMLASSMEQRIVGFEDWISNFLSLWCFPIGVWFVQPRVNRLENDVIA